MYKNTKSNRTVQKPQMFKRKQFDCLDKIVNENINDMSKEKFLKFLKSYAKNGIEQTKKSPKKLTPFLKPRPHKLSIPTPKPIQRHTSFHPMQLRR